MSIVHLSSLKPSDFLSVFGTLNHISTEKIDGNSFRILIDNEKKSFSIKRTYGTQYHSDVDDIKLTPENLEIISLLTLFKTIEYKFFDSATIQKTLEPMGSKSIDFESIYTRQPNAIVYVQPTTIVFHTISEVTTMLHHMINKSDPVQKYDIEFANIKCHIYGNGMSKWRSVLLKTKDITLSSNVLVAINDYKYWLSGQSVIKNKTNEELIYTSMSTIQLKHRSAVVAARATTRDQSFTQQNNICKIYLDDYLVTNKSLLGSSMIEGLVIDSVFSTYKIVDKHTFTSINNFYHKKRNEIKNTSTTKSNDLYRYCFMNIWEMFNVDVDKSPTYIQTTNKLKTFGPTKLDIIDSLVSVLDSNGIDVTSMKNEITTNLDTTIRLLKSQLDHYKLEYRSGKISTRINNKKVSYTVEINKRTRTLYVSFHNELLELRKAIIKCDTRHECIESLFRRNFEKIDTH